MKMHCTAAIIFSTFSTGKWISNHILNRGKKIDTFLEYPSLKMKDEIVSSAVMTVIRFSI